MLVVCSTEIFRLLFYFSREHGADTVWRIWKPKLVAGRQTCVRLTWM